MCSNKDLQCQSCPGNKKEVVSESLDERIDDHDDRIDDHDDRLFYLADHTEDLKDRMAALENSMKTKSIIVEKIYNVVLVSIFVLIFIDIVTNLIHLFLL